MTREEATIRALRNHIEVLEENIRALEQPLCEDATPVCVFYCRYDECPIEIGETVHIGDKVYKAVKPFHKTTAYDGECVIGGFWEIENDTEGI